MNGHGAVVEEIVERLKGTTIESRVFGQTLEVPKSYNAVVEWLKKNGDMFRNKVRLAGWGRLYLIAIDRWTRTIKLVVESDMAISAREIMADESLLHWAAKDGLSGTVSLLLQIGADKEAQGKDGRTPLWRAAVNGHETVVRMLIENGAYVDIKDKDNQALLQQAASNGHMAVYQMLAENGTHVDIRDKDSQTPL
jgi:hypothetical protein